MPPSPEPTNATPPSSNSSPFGKRPTNIETILVVLGLLFIPIVGVVLMWIWMPWNKWVKVLITVVPIILAIIGFATAFYVLSRVLPMYENTAKQQLEQQLLPTPTQALKTPAPSVPIASPTASITLQENIQAAIESKNTAALEGYMNDTVFVLLYASECCGQKTKADAVGQLSYLNPAKAPWNWNQNDPTIVKIKTSQPSTFGKGMIGISGNKYTVSFEIVNNKISSYYLSPTYELLIQ